MKSGYSKIDITPKPPCPMVGFHTEAIGVLDPIYIKSIILGHLRFVVFDTLYVPNIKMPSVILSATHTHSSISPEVVYYSRYDEIPKEQIHDVKIEYGETSTPDIVCRRKKIYAWHNIKRGVFKKTYEMRPNPKDTFPQKLKALKIHLEPMVIMYNFGCHCTMNHKPLISADWPGYVNVDNAEMVFLQGFCGDILPNLIKESTTFKDKFIAKIEGTNDFRKYDTSTEDMEGFASTVSERIGNISYREVG